jgi:hypothetical protein
MFTPQEFKKELLDKKQLTNTPDFADVIHQ